MKFIFEGDHHALRSLTSRIARMEYMETDGSVLIGHLDSNHPAIVAHVASLPGITVLPDHHAPLHNHHVEKLAKFGIEKGDTVRIALDKVHARHPHAIANTSLPIH